jgi:hypothetical protein
MRHVRLNAQRRPITSTRRPKPNAPTLVHLSDYIENIVTTYARPALAHAQMLPLSMSVVTHYSEEDTHYEPGGTPISWLADLSTVQFVAARHSLNSRSNQTNALSPGEVEEVTEAAQKPDT